MQQSQESDQLERQATVAADAGPSESADTRPEPAASLRTWLGEAGALTWRWVKTFVATIAVFAGAGIVLGVICCWVMPGGWGPKTTAGIGAAVVCTVLGVLLAPQRATAEAGSFIVLRHRLASRIVEFLLDSCVRDDSRIAAAAGKLPLAEAEARLRQGVAAMGLDRMAVGPITRWIVRRVYRQLTCQIEKYTLAAYRSEATEGGTVDMKLVQQRLAARIDQEVAGRIAAGPKRLVRVALIACVVLCLGVSVACRVLIDPSESTPAPASMPTEVDAVP